jgi:hypothetical protein
LLPPHVGNAKIASHGSCIQDLPEPFRRLAQWSAAKTPDRADHDFDATVFCPPSGSPLILLRGPADARLTRDFGEGLTIKGDSPDGAFEMCCPHYCVEAVSERGAERSWAVAKPNGLASISYGEERPIARVHAIINNFDFEWGNPPHAANGLEVLRVQAGGRDVEFVWRENHQELRLLLDCGVLRSTALTVFSFDGWEGASEGDLTAFAWNVASLCTIAARQHTGVPVLTFLDGDGRPVKRVIGEAIESPFRAGGNFRFPQLDDALPRLFRDCFDEHVRMQGSPLWARVPWLCASIEDPPYLEQKVASLMTAVEVLVRGTLVEDGRPTPEPPERMTFPTLVGTAKNQLGWDVPKHYTKGNRHQLLRNAVAHGNDLPSCIEEVRNDFDKWHLFLIRRLLLRLGYAGQVASPRQGWAASSLVDDFSETHNSFKP